MNTFKIALAAWLLLPTLLTAQDMPRHYGCRRGYLLEQPQRQQRRAKAISFKPSLYQGERHQLTVLAQFSDTLFHSADPEAQWNRILNEVDFREEPYHGSVRDYFAAQSYGQFQIRFDVQKVCVGPIKRYMSTRINDENSQFLVDDVIDSLLTRDIDWSLYDWDGDGEIEQLLIIFAGKGMNDGGGSRSIWPHQWLMSHHVDLVNHQIDDMVYRSARTFTVNDKTYTIDNYCATNEMGQTFASFGTLCHEYSHCFGLPDFYYDTKSYVDRWDIMDRGNYNSYGYCPAGYSAHERWLMGWLTPIELTAATTVKDMPALCDEPVAYLIRNSGFDNEYYLVENRQRRGWDADLPGSGVVIAHVDYDEDSWTSFSNPPNHYPVSETETRNRYTIFPANYNFYTAFSSGWSYPSESNDSLTDSSRPAARLCHPNAEGSLYMSQPLTRISVSEGLASFTFMGGDSTTSIEPHHAAGSHQSYRLFDLAGRPVRHAKAGQIVLVRQTDGTVSKQRMGQP